MTLLHYKEVVEEVFPELYYSYRCWFICFGIGIQPKIELLHTFDIKTNAFIIDRQDDHDFHFFTDVHVFEFGFTYINMYSYMNLVLLLRCNTFMEWEHFASKLGFGILYEYFRLFNTKPGICYLCPMIKMVFLKSKHCNDISLKLVIKFCWHFYAVSYTSVDFVLSFLLNFERKKQI